MPLEITWATIAKLMLAGFATYVITPAFLVLRDWVLRKTLEKFVYTKSLQKIISEYARKEHLLESEYSAAFGGGFRDGKNYFIVGDKEVSLAEYSDYCAMQTSLVQSTQLLFVKINGKAAMINWLFKHYKQDEPNPITEWLELERKRFSGNGSIASETR